MFDIFIDAYVRFFAVLLPALLITLVTLGAARAGLNTQQTLRTAAFIAALFGIWFAISSLLGQAGLLMPPPTLTDPPIVLFVLFGGAALLFTLARGTNTGRSITDALGQDMLIGFQIPRIMGAVFVLGWLLGAIPWQFALPAGLGDIWAGVAGYRAMRATQRGDPNAAQMVLRANIIGLADFAVAIVTGLITSEGFLHLLSRDAPNIINAYPLALFPGFFVALFTAMHMLSLSRLRQDNRAEALA